MRDSFIITAILIFFNILPLFSQVPDHQQVIEELIEELIVTDMPAGDLTLIYDDLLFYVRYPIDINTASADDLTKLYFLNELQISNLIEYRGLSGNFATVYELQYIEGFSQDDIRRMLPFISVGEITTLPVLSPSAALKYGRHQYFLRFQQVIQQQRGFAPITDSALAASPSSRYLGSPLKIYKRYQFNYRNQVLAGFVAEKDAGEEFFRGSNPLGFDYYTIHFQVNNVGKFRTIALGDFQTGFGQGLVLWSGLAFGKSANTVNTIKNPRGIQKYSSTDENLFMRGVGVTYRFSENTEGSLFVSRKKIDAGVSLTDEEGRILEVSYLQNTGLHATPSQMVGKNVLGETILGGNMSYNHRYFKLGATAVAIEYDAVLNPPERLYNQFDFRGSRNINGGLDYQFAVGKVRFFGEGAVSSSGGTALLGGAMSNLGSKISVSALYRKYARDYHAYFSNGFRENTCTANEEGFYLGALVHPFRRFRLSAWFDFFSFPWLRYSAWAPSSGIEYFLQADFNLSREMHMYLILRHKSKPVNAPAGDAPVRQLYDAGTSRLRYHINYSLSTAFEFRNRVEISKYSREDISPERGFMMYQDILYKPAKLPISLAFRYAVFETDTYNARLYAYENDILYAFSIPAYYDRGFRTYLLVQYSAGAVVDLWVRYALTRLPGRESIGTGLNEISGDARSEIKAQLRLRF
jgi:hypothetical protein